MTATAPVDPCAHERPHEGVAPPTFHNGARGRWNAWFFTSFDRYINFITRDHKRRVFGGIRPGDIVELGAGVGANFAFIPAGSRLYAVEPNLAMHPGLVRRAAEHDLDLDLLERPPVHQRADLGAVVEAEITCWLEDCGGLGV